MYPNAAACSFRHLERMTDDTGMLEHCTGIIPNRREGYSTDDNARALWAGLVWTERLAGNPQAKDQVRLLKRLTDTYLAFLLWAQRENGRMHNNFYYDRTPETETASEDCQGRVLWAAAYACAQSIYPDLRLPAWQLLRNGMQHVENMAYPRGWAYSLSAVSLLLQQERPICDECSTAEWKEIRSRIAFYAHELESRLLDAFKKHAEPGWRWFEPTMTYGNGVLPWSLFSSYRFTGNKRSLETAMEALHFLAERMTAPQGWIRPVGNRGWGTKKGQAVWDQQPLDVMKLGLAAEAAYKLTKRSEYREIVAACRNWFHGQNDKSVPMADPIEGSCSDGLTPEGPNGNRGAESTLSYLLMEAVYDRVFTDGGGADSVRDLAFSGVGTHKR